MDLTAGRTGHRLIGLPFIPGRVIRKPALHVEAHCWASVDKGGHGTCFLQVPRDPSIQGMYVGSAPWAGKGRRIAVIPVAALPRKKQVCDPGYIAPEGESLCCERWMNDEQPDWWDWRWAGYLPACWFSTRLQASDRVARLRQSTRRASPGITIRSGATSSLMSPRAVISLMRFLSRARETVLSRAK